MVEALIKESSIRFGLGRFRKRENVKPYEYITQSRVSYLLTVKSQNRA